MNPIFAADLLCQPRTSVRGSGFSNPRKRSVYKFWALALVYVFLLAWPTGKHSLLLN